MIRDATESDCPAATALCLRSKASWGYDEHFMERCRDVLTLTPERLASWTVRVAEAPNGALVGVVGSSPGDTPEEAELELMFIEPAWMGKGVGAALMKDIIGELVEEGVETLWILSDPGAEPFYLRLGAVRVNQRPSDAVPERVLPWLRLDLT